MEWIPEHIGYLLNGYNTGTLSVSERAELEAWVTAAPENGLLFDELTDPERLRGRLQQMETFDEPGKWAKIKPHITPVVPLRHRSAWLSRIAAAIILLFLSAGIFYLFTHKHAGAPVLVQNKPTPDINAPATTRAAITLSNGQQVYLDSATSGRLATQNNVQLVKLTNGAITYNYSPSLPGQGRSEIFNTLVNPRGSQVINIVLSDGSRIWLNAGSSLRYPVAFTGDKRNVSVSGEAYFEITHDPSRPFSVTTGDLQVQVLGTHFNVNAYREEDAVNVTLLEGSIGIHMADNRQTKQLQPGQQAAITEEKITVTTGIDEDQVMAWKNGFFSFRNTPLKAMLNEIARWYGIDVSYEGNIPKIRTTGMAPRSISLDTMLKLLQLSKVKYRIEDRKLIVME